MGRWYPPYQSVYSRFYKWRDDDTLETVFHILNADLENLSIKAHPQSAAAKKGQYNPFISTSHGGKNTKIYTIVYGWGNPISFLLSGGQMGISLLETIDIHGSDIIADRAYGYEEISKYIIATYMIPPKRNTKEHGLWIGIDIWLNVFFINSNNLVVLLLDRIS